VVTFEKNTEMTIDKHEYLQVGYRPYEFENVKHYELERINKTAVDPNPINNRWWRSQGDQYHHIFVESFIEFARYIPNKYDIIHFTRGATDYEIELAKRILSNDGEIILLNCTSEKQTVQPLDDRPIAEHPSVSVSGQ